MNKNHPENLIVKKRGGGERIIPYYKWWILRNTPHGEDADIVELMPYDGMKYIDRCSIIRKESAIKKCGCGMQPEIKNSYSTASGHGFVVLCQCGNMIEGKTYNNTINKWNKNIIKGDYNER